MTVTATKTRTNVYLDTAMKKQAQAIFKQYGMGLNDAFNPKYAIEIIKLAKVIAQWAFTKNHRLTFGLNSNSLQTPMH